MLADGGSGLKKGGLRGCGWVGRGWIVWEED